MRMMIQAALPFLLGFGACADDLSSMQRLGKSLFFDSSLSVNGNQPCAHCHDPDQGFSSPHGDFNAAGGVVEGSVPGRFGNRKPPSAAYVSPGPVLHHTFEDGEILFVGGAFVDGRATGHVNGSVAADQAMGPFTNPVEMGMPHPACVVLRACEEKDAEDYPLTLGDVWGAGVCEIDFPAELDAQCGDPDARIEIADEALSGAVDAAFVAIARSIAAYESSSEVNSFNSRFDRWMAGEEELSEQERAGLTLFKGKAMCAECHVLDRGPHGEAALFTDYTYDNLGVPANPQNPWYAQAEFNPDGADWVDLGLGAFLATDAVYDVVAPGMNGKQKVPTLRNVDARITPDAPKAYMHNGYFKTLEGVVSFYNTRDVRPRCDALLTEAEALEAKCWPAPEVAENVNRDELGDLGLTAADEAALVAFLKTLTSE